MTITDRPPASPSRSDACLSSPARRRLLLGIVAAGGTGLLAPLTVNASTSPAVPAPPASLVVPFRGEHQAGITTP